MNDLIDAAGLVLYKFTEDKEDWDEYVNLARGLHGAIIHAKMTQEDFTGLDRAQRRLNEFNERRNRRGLESV